MTDRMSGRWRRLGAASAVVALACSALVLVPGTASAASAGPGIGSEAALAAPGCDADTGRLAVQWYAAPPCVRPFEDGDDNGGATARGVTADAIKVTVLIPPAEKDQSSTNGGITDQATGQNGLSTDAVLDLNAIFEQYWQTWGRTVEYEFVDASGTDEPAQRADAVTVIATKPFAVIDAATYAQGGGGEVFQRQVQAAKIEVVPPPQSQAEIYAPYVKNTAEFAGKNLVKKEVEFAGDALNGEPRVFGVVYEGGSSGIDISVFDEEFTEHGGKTAVELEYSAPIDPTRTVQDAAFQEQAPTLVAKMKDAGVTTVINLATGSFGGMTKALTTQATAQDWFPEWVQSGIGYQDLDFFARLVDQEQWAHAFGPVWFVPYVEGESKDSIVNFFQWYWGTDQGTRSPGIFSNLLRLYNGVQLAGPKLTPRSFNRALRNFEPVGGAYSGMITNLETGYPPAGTIPPRGSAIGWWNPDVEGPSNQIGIAGKGKYMYLDGGKRYITGKFPKNVKGLFDESASIATLPAVPDVDLVGPYPCDGCPSSGGSQQASQT